MFHCCLSQCCFLSSLKFYISIKKLLRSAGAKQMTEDMLRLFLSSHPDLYYYILFSVCCLPLSQLVPPLLPLSSLSPISPVLLTWFLSLQAALLMFWWPGPGSLALLLTLTEVLLSPTTSQTLRATTLYHCINHLVFLWLAVCMRPSIPALCPSSFAKCWTQMDPPHTFHS